MCFLKSIIISTDNDESRGSELVISKDNHDSTKVFIYSDNQNRKTTFKLNYNFK